MSDETGAEREGLHPGLAALRGVPLPAGAVARTAGMVNWRGLPFFLVRDLDLNPETFGDFAFATFRIHDSAERVVGFYRDGRTGWEERLAVVDEGGGMVLWTSVDGRVAVWIGASRTIGGTELAIASAKRNGSTD